MAGFEEERAVRYLPSSYLKHHWRFYASAAFGILVWISTGMLARPLHVAIAGDAFFGGYLLSALNTVINATSADMRRRAASRDEGIFLITLLTLAAVSLSLGSIFLLVNEPEKPNAAQLMLAMISVPLGWTTLHTIMGFHYAHLFYRRHSVEVASDAGGLQFPGTEEPALWDFLYYSFVVGMTAQVSDVQVRTTPMRRITLAHGVVSFFFNAVILALAVNIAVGSAH
ncbi:DUF1345 domain-containing protein [Microvirga sp. TS319]|uniref:DUF1345 domain-containing protein n=1 Tax=Microvirga sp. TS319 TaxID=3241165 RepID=UPI003519FB44